jgi:hypothetical protein
LSSPIKLVPFETSVDLQYSNVQLLVFSSEITLVLSLHNKLHHDSIGVHVDPALSFDSHWTKVLLSIQVSTNHLIFARDAAPSNPHAICYDHVSDLDLHGCSLCAVQPPSSPHQVPPSSQSSSCPVANFEKNLKKFFEKKITMLFTKFFSI